MSAIIRMALVGAIKSLLGSEWWGKVRQAVNDLANVEIPGEEKRAMVVTALKGAGYGLASWLLNLAIEVAVAVLMDEIAEMEKEGQK